MKLLILLTLVSLQLSATGFSQEVTLSFRNAPLEKVFSKIKEQTGYSFIYTRQQLKNTLPVNCDIKKASLHEALAICFTNQPLSFLIEDRYVVVITKPLVLDPVTQAAPVINIHGTVVNQKGDPLSGVSIFAKVSRKGTVSDDHGKFSLSAVDEKDVLVITSIGYEKQEVPVKNRSEFLVTLSVSINSLDETIIRGYYNTTRRFNTGSVGKVSSKEIQIQPVSNPLAALEGRVAGLFITQANGLPGSNFSVRIRGQNSIQNGNSPLYIIDGVPFLTDADRLTQRSGINANSPFNNINPDDIESIEILKDADATAIYGSRGANGVILITTKKGNAGQASLDVNVYTGWGKVTRSMDYLDTKQYLEMRREAFANDGIPPSVSSAPDLLLWDTSRYINWKKLLIGNTAASKNIQLRLSGGTALVNYSVSANYYRESTVFPGDFYDERTSVNFNTRHASANKRFTALFTTSLARNISNLPSQDLTQYINLPPNMYQPYDDNGKLRWSEAGYSYGNPFNILVQKNKGTTNRVTTSSLLTYELLRGLKFKVSLGYNDIRFDEAIRFPIAAQDPSLNPKGSATFGNNQVRSWIFEPQAEYVQTLLSKAKITVLLGATLNENENSSSLIRGSGYTNDDLINSTSGAATLLASNAFNQYRYQAAFTRFNMVWDNSLLLNLTGRRDGSSRFGPGNRFANFGAVGMGWIFSENRAIQNLLPFLSYGKIRGSYGIVGNDQIGNYQYLDSWTTTQYPYQSVPSLRPTRLYNPDYSWEQNKKVELGLELGFWNDRIFLVINRYDNRSENQIIRYNLPAQTGFNDLLRNFPGKVQNRGWEIELKTTNINAHSFEWNTSFNFSASKNKLVQFPGLESSSYAGSYVIGQSLNVIQGYRYTGLDKDNGIYTFQDVNGDGVINFLDYTVLGDTDPRFYGGVQNSIKYKSWELDFLFQFTRQKGYDAIYKLQNAVGGFINQPAVVMKRWQKPGDDNPFERFTQDFNNPAYYPATYLVSQSDAALTDASFLRMKNVSLGYGFDKLSLKKLHLQNCRLYIEGQNLFTFTNYPGFDPEAQNITSLSPLKMIVTGLQIKF